MLGVRNSVITKFRTVCPGVLVVGGRRVQGTGSRRKAKRMQGLSERDTGEKKGKVGRREDRTELETRRNRAPRRERPRKGGQGGEEKEKKDMYY